MIILGIESSCDETASAIVQNGQQVLSNVIASSIALHQKTGGVVPEVAARDAARQIHQVINQSLEEARLTWKEIDAIAVTNGPGLAGSLMVGIEAARTLAYLHQKPLIPVQHILGHIYSNKIEREEIIFPSLVLTVSGGHNNLLLWSEYLEFEELGHTLDDSAGEAFDKVAKMLGLPFPGGPEISRLAEQGDSQAFQFPRPMSQSDDFNFSFSGLKTAVMYTLRDNPQAKKEDIAASFQQAVVDSLAIKTHKAIREYQPQALYLAGGVSANQALQKALQKLCTKNNIQFFTPQKTVYSTDNAAMIAAAGYQLFATQDDWDWRKVRLQLGQKLTSVDKNATTKP